jgi:hypothetical protein
LVGPGTWDGVAPILTEEGFEVHVPDLRPTLEAGRPYCARQIGLIESGAGDGPAVLVGHSGAGALLAPAGRTIGPVLGYVFVDAGLPIPGRTQMSTMPPDLVDELRRMADGDGWLPPWPQWWGDDALAELLPDAARRRRFAAECRRIPLGMFDEVLPDGRDAPGAYLRLSEAYAEPAAEARKRGWPLIDLDEDHLAPISKPGVVAGALLDLLDQVVPAQTG